MTSPEWPFKRVKGPCAVRDGVDLTFWYQSKERCGVFTRSPAGKFTKADALTPIMDLHESKLPDVNIISKDSPAWRFYHGAQLDLYAMSDGAALVE